MNCPTCGTQLADGSPFCSTCGANLGGRLPAFGQAQFNPYGGQPQPPMMQMQRTSGMAIAGFILAMLSCSLFGLIFSIIGYNECKKSLGTVKGEGLAIAGIIISVVWMLFGALYFVSLMGTHSSSHYYGY